MALYWQGNVMIRQVLPRLFKVCFFVMGGQVIEVGADDIGALGRDIGHDAHLVIGFGLTFFDADGAQRAGADAGAQSVAEKVGDQPGLVVDELQRPFGTIGQALSAAIAYVLVNENDISFHVVLLSLMVSNSSSERHSLVPARGRSKL